MKAPLEPNFHDDTYYPKPLLKKMAEKGLNVANLLVVPGMYHADHSGKKFENIPLFDPSLSKMNCLFSQSLLYNIQHKKGILFHDILLVHSDSERQ